MYHRLLEVDKEKAKVLKGFLKQAKNNTERKRIQILVLYMWWMNTTEVSASMAISYQTVHDAVTGYKKKGNDFYKTNRRWRQENDQNKRLAEQIKKFIDAEENVDINEVRRYLEKENGREIDYWKVHRLVRRKLWYNYQKPFVTNNKQSEYAKEIAEWRMRKWLFEIAMAERQIDAESVQNKKI